MNASRNGFFHHFANSRKVRVDFFARMKHQFVFHRQTGNGEPRSFTGGKQFRSILIGVRHGLFGLRLSEAELIDLAAGLGSDTAFFVRNTPQLCTGRGEIMEPYPLCLVGMTLVVVKPDVGVSTREAYAGVRPHVPEVPLAERLRRPVVEWQGLVTNDFEPHIFAAHPAIREARDSLLAAGAVYASMSGSGSAVFGLFDDAQKAGNLRLQTPFVYTL